MEPIMGDGLVQSRLETAGAGDHKGRPYGVPPVCRAVGGGCP